MKALVVGGTGATGHFVVNGLIERGYRVAMLHSGRHEVPEIPDEVEHLHADAYSADSIRDALGDRSFDVTIASYGRLRAIAEILAGRTGRFVSIGGVPAYRGYMNAGLFDPAGIPVPVPETAPRVAETREDEKGWRIVRTEDAVFDHHPGAAHFRYPIVYGAYQPMPREWCVVRRVLDGRTRMVVPDGGLTLCHCGYAANCAHALLLAVDQPEAAAGEIFNCGDSQVLSLAQMVAHTARALDAELEIVSMPFALAAPARPLLGMPWSTHRVLDLTKLISKLGYSDVVSPEEGLATTARWLRDHPPEPGGAEETVLQDPFDYEAEDELMDAWQKLVAQMPDVEFEGEPGYTLSYSGPGGRNPTGTF